MTFIFQNFYSYGSREFSVKHGIQQLKLHAVVVQASLFAFLTGLPFLYLVIVNHSTLIPWKSLLHHFKYPANIIFFNIGVLWIRLVISCMSICVFVLWMWFSETPQPKVCFVKNLLFLMCVNYDKFVKHFFRETRRKKITLQIYA